MLYTLYRLRQFVTHLLQPAAPDDPVEKMSARERADLPPYHPTCPTC